MFSQKVMHFPYIPIHCNTHFRLLVCMALAELTWPCSLERSLFSWNMELFSYDLKIQPLSTSHTKRWLCCHHESPLSGTPHAIITFCEELQIKNLIRETHFLCILILFNPYKTKWKRTSSFQPQRGCMERLPYFKESFILFHKDRAC